MLYDRKIKYLDYYESGTKVNGGGFVKLEVREDTLRIEMTIRGLHPTDSFERDIVLQGAEKEEILGQIRIQNGFGQFRYSCSADQGIGGTGISYSDLRGIRISIGGTREILCQWDKVPGKRRITLPEGSVQKSKSVLQESIIESHSGNKADSEAPIYIENEQKHELKPEKAENAEDKRKEVKKEGYENIEDKNIKEENKEDIDLETQGDKNREDKSGEGQEDENREDIEKKESIEDTTKDIEKKESIERNNKGLVIRGEDMKNDVHLGATEMQAQGAAEFSDAISPQFPEDQIKEKPDMAGNSHEEQPDVRKAPVKLMEDKWQQLSAIYPHIQPFRDERDYLSLTPSDFVLFPDRFYRAVNNSFLLHGYYNYHHLILARIERRGEIIYYIGVPGNYYEREKQVAIMFGFESFECEAEPAKTGDFGYYMMRTEL